MSEALTRIDRTAITSAQIHELRANLARAATVLEAKSYREFAAAVADIQRRQRRLRETKELREAVTEVELDTAEFRIEAFRREGDLLRVMFERGERARDGNQPLHHVTVKPLTLDQLGYPHRVEGMRAQDVAAIKDGVVRKYFAAQRPKREVATVAGLMMFAADAAKRRDTITPAVPAGTYRTIVIDPPWPMDKSGRYAADERASGLGLAAQGTRLDYPVMELDQIAALPVPDLATDGTSLYLWVTQRFLPDGLRLVEHWGFTYHCLLTWTKPSGFAPFSFMFNTEHALFAYRPPLDLARLGLKIGFSARATGHSVKPDAFYTLVEEASFEPRLEMFARRARPGWVAWGDEAP